MLLFCSEFCEKLNLFYAQIINEWVHFMPHHMFPKEMKQFLAFSYPLGKCFNISIVCVNVKDDIQNAA